MSTDVTAPGRFTQNWAEGERYDDVLNVLNKDQYRNIGLDYSGAQIEDLDGALNSGDHHLAMAALRQVLSDSSKTAAEKDAALDAFLANDEVFDHNRLDERGIAALRSEIEGASSQGFEDALDAWADAILIAGGSADDLGRPADPAARAAWYAAPGTIETLATMSAALGLVPRTGEPPRDPVTDPADPDSPPTDPDAPGGATPRTRIDYGSMNITEMILALQIERTELLDKELQDQAEHMRERNELLREANNMLEKLRNARPQEKGDDDDPNKAAVPADVRSWCTANGIDLKSGSLTQEEFDAAVTSVKAYVDANNNEAQLDMIRLQSLMNKRNQAFDLMTNIIQKVQKALDNIVSNTR